MKKYTEKEVEKIIKEMGFKEIESGRFYADPELMKKLAKKYGLDISSHTPPVKQ